MWKVSLKALVNKKESRKLDLVGVPIPGVDAAVLIVELHGAGDGLGEGEAGGGGGGAGELVPERRRHVLGHQRVLGLDLGHRVRHREAVEAEGHDGNDKSLKNIN